MDNGDDAVARARELRPDIVLADVVMPGMNGYEVCEAIKSDPQLRHVPVLLLTGTFEAFDEARAAQVGADGHITKPFEAQALVDTVNARLAAGPVAPPAEERPVTPAAARDEATASGAEADDGFGFFDEETTEPGQRGAGDGGATVLLGDALAAAAPDDDLPSDASGRFRADAGSDAPTPPDAFAAAPPPEAAAETPAPMDAFESLDDPELSGADTLPPVPAAARTAPPTADAPELDAPVDADEGMDDDWFGSGSPATDAFGAGDSLADVAPDDLAGETLIDPAGARDYDVSSSDLGDPLAAFALPQDEAPTAFAAPEPAPVAPAEPPRAEPRPADPSFAPPPEAAELLAAAPDAADAPRELSPLAREQLHEALEKIAWEAFSDVSERIVRDALERIEQVAWEVIPQMAEALIREEIRRLKGEE